MKADSITEIAEKEIYGANILHVEVGTNGKQGGDGGHGGRTHFALSDEGGTCWKVSVSEDGRSLAIDLEGDSELETFAEALEFASRDLRRKAVFDSDLPLTVLEQIEVVERDLALLAAGGWATAESKRGADQLREAASRMVLSAKHLESLVKSETFPTL
jgi:hypothetical protein